jgi:hypothetical protein
MSGDQMAQMAFCIMKNGGDPNCQVVRSESGYDADQLGMTALHLLCMQRNERLVLPMFRALLTLGTNPMLKDAFGRTVEDYVVLRERHDVHAALVSGVYVHYFFFNQRRHGTRVGDEPLVGAKLKR